MTVNPFTLRAATRGQGAALRRGTSNTGALYARYGKLTVAVDIDPATPRARVRREGLVRGENVDKEEAKDTWRRA